jgi:hypothetical protein
MLLILAIIGPKTVMLSFFLDLRVFAGAGEKVLEVVPRFLSSRVTEATMARPE